jgi:hypothetical protein
MKMVLTYDFIWYKEDCCIMVFEVKLLIFIKRYLYIMYKIVREFAAEIYNINILHKIQKCY